MRSQPPAKVPTDRGISSSSQPPSASPRANSPIRKLAERVGFEPTLEFPLNTLSKRAPSTTRPSLLGKLEMLATHRYTVKRSTVEPREFTREAARTQEYHGDVQSGGESKFRQSALKRVKKSSAQFQRRPPRLAAPPRLVAAIPPIEAIPVEAIRAEALVAATLLRTGERLLPPPKRLPPRTAGERPPAADSASRNKVIHDPRTEKAVAKGIPEHARSRDQGVHVVIRVIVPAALPRRSAVKPLLLKP